MKTPKITINDKTGKTWEFKSLDALKKFFQEEHDFWEKEIGDLNRNYRNLNYLPTKDSFLKAVNVIKTLEDQRSNWDEIQLNTEIKKLEDFIWSKHPFVPIWIKLIKESDAAANEFVLAILNDNKNYHISNDKRSLKGFILGHVYTLYGESEVIKRFDNASKKFGVLSNRLENEEKSLTQNINHFNQDMDSWKNGTFDYSQKIKRVFSKLFKRSEQKRIKEFNKYFNEAKERIQDLEKTYQEKLRLEKPATYWKNKAENYGEQGKKWSRILGGGLAAGLGLFSFFFYCWLSGQKIGIELNSLQGVILFATILSIYAFFLKTISKLVFSSFHLQRDAEEREQLTYVYLSLINADKKIEAESRNIVLQALFSRSDSGLLGKDSSPTMPGLPEIMKATVNK